MAVILKKPLADQLATALGNLREARRDGDWSRIKTAQVRFDWLVDQIPRAETLAC